MFARCGVRVLLLFCLGAALIGCSNAGLDSIQVSPTSQSLTVGQTAQFTATGTYGNGGHGTTEDITSAATWSSTAVGVATVSSAGLVTAVGAGTTTITATARAFNGTVSSSAIVTVIGSSSSNPTLVSLAIVPTEITVGNLQDTGQFLAFGTYSDQSVRDLTNSPNLTWISATPSIFPVSNGSGGGPGATAGIVTAYGDGSGLITAEYTASNGTVQEATANFNCPLVIPTATTAGSCYPNSQAAALLATLTVYNEGLNNTNWLVTAPSATGTPNVIDCGPGAGSASVCSATYPVGSTVTLTAPANGASFGGWSYNCTNTGTITAVGPNTCTVTLTTNDTVGVVFN